MLNGQTYKQLSAEERSVIFATTLGNESMRPEPGVSADH
ncbi:hypothetical protein PAMC26577_12990 [Caballeronia sordidicola]|uniref:Uncharacterized protein n=1 Tax=Caballeronia sordidicola TaxID=196367 RepID=A0A242MW57_CABSO|nr:hypothetical protein PAMC26577_12990 [Caballeronia sordidicola]